MRTGRSVGIVGSGPAGLAAAQQLARAGHAVTVYERDDRPGGLLRYGIPDFKLEKNLIDRRVEQLVAEGVEFALGVSVGDDVPFDGAARPATTRWCWRRARSATGRSRCRAPSSPACISQWSTWCSRTGASRACP